MPPTILIPGATDKKEVQGGAEPRSSGRRHGDTVASAFRRKLIACPRGFRRLKLRTSRPKRVNVVKFRPKGASRFRVIGGQSAPLHLPVLRG